MMRNIKSIVEEIDNKIRGYEWLDFHVLSFDGSRLIVAGSTDLIYFHEIEIIFENVFFISGFLKGWHSDTKKEVFVLPENEKELNEKWEIEQGYQLFLFKIEDYNNDVLIAAENVLYNSDVVYYYERPGLKENERIAEFVKNKPAL